MNVMGTRRIDATPEAVYRAICDPATLMAVIPGCESVEQVGSDEYVGRIVLRLPGVVDEFRSHVRVVDAVLPERAGLEGQLEGTAGSISGRADFELTRDSGWTAINYRGRAVIQGPLARLDSRFAEHLAETLIDQGLRALGELLARKTASAAGEPARAKDVPAATVGNRRSTGEARG